MAVKTEEREQGCIRLDLVVKLLCVLPECRPVVMKLICTVQSETTIRHTKFNWCSKVHVVTVTVMCIECSDCQLQSHKHALCFNRNFSRWTWVSRYQKVSILDFIGVKDDGVVVITGAVRCAKLQSYCHDQQTSSQLYTGRIPFLSPKQQCQNTDVSI